MHALCLNHLLIFDASTAHDSFELKSGQNYFNRHQLKKTYSFAFMCHIYFPPRNGLESRIITQDPDNTRRGVNSFLKVGGQVVMLPGGSFYSAKIWGGNCHPCHPCHPCPPCIDAPAVMVALMSSPFYIHR